MESVLQAADKLKCIGPIGVVRDPRVLTLTKDNLLPAYNTLQLRILF